MDGLKQSLAIGSDIVRHQAKLGKTRLELFQLERDRRKVFERLGREVYRKLLEEEVPRLPEFARPFQVLQELDERIRVLEEQIGGV